MENINWLGIIVGALVPMVMGMIWYSPPLFGKAWLTSIGKTEEELKAGSNMGVTMTLSLILSFLLSFFLYGMLGIHDYITVLSEGEGSVYPHDFFHGMYHGAFLGVLVAAPVLITNSLFEQRGWTNILINAAYWILTVTLMGGVISLFL